MDTIKLKGKSKKGKQRIGRFGEIWHVKETQKTKLLLTSACGKDLRWIDLPIDPDFEIVDENRN